MTGRACTDAPEPRAAAWLRTSSPPPQRLPGFTAAPAGSRVGQQATRVPGKQRRRVGAARACQRCPQRRRRCARCREERELASAKRPRSLFLHRVRPRAAAFGFPGRAVQRFYSASPPPPVLAYGREEPPACTPRVLRALDLRFALISSPRGPICCRRERARRASPLRPSALGILTPGTRSRRSAHGQAPGDRRLGGGAQRVLHVGVSPRR